MPSAGFHFGFASLLGVALLLAASPALPQHQHTTPSAGTSPGAPRGTQPAAAQGTSSGTARPTRPPADPALRTPTPGGAAPLVHDLVAQALSRYPAVAALEERLKAAREEVEPAGALPDPMVGAMYQGVGDPWNPMPLMTMAQLEVTQPLFYPGKRKARRRAAVADASVKEAQLLELQWRLVTEIRQAYARIFAIDRERESVLAAQELMSTLGHAVAARYASGQAEQEALAKTTLERFMLSERLTDLDAERAEWVAAINQLAQRPRGASFGTVRALPDARGGVMNPSAANLDHSPSLQMRRAEIRAARERVEAANLESRPNFVVGLAGGATFEGEPVITARFGVELPLWSSSKQQPMVRAARHRLHAARAEWAAGEAEIRAELEKLQARWKRDGDQMTLFEEAILPQTNTAMQAALSAYVAGRGDFSNVIEDFRLWLDARVSLARRAADRYMTWAVTQALLGGPLPGSRP